MTDWGCLTDIVKEYPLGLEVINELSCVYIGYVIHSLFYISLLLMLFKVIVTSSKQNIEKSTYLGEHFFVTMNLLGILCAGIGLFLTLAEIQMDLNPDKRKWFILPAMIFILFPYAIVFFSWLYQVIKEKNAGLLDEKQRTDMTKAGITTWIVSMPLMFALFLLNYFHIGGSGSIFWFPFYIYLTLLIFSSGNLFFFKKG